MINLDDKCRAWLYISGISSGSSVCRKEKCLSSIRFRYFFFHSARKMRGTILKVVTTLLLLNGFVQCSPKYQVDGFVPSSVDYLSNSAPKSQDQLAVPSQRSQEGNDQNSHTKLSPSETNDITDRTQEPRFGFTNVGGTGSGYGVSSYAPTKIDLGGLLLGAVIGIGTVLIIPKLLYVLSGSYGAYARSDEGGIMHIMTTLDDALSRHGIDTTSCMQRTVCSYSKRAAETMRNAAMETNETQDQISPLDRMVDALATNQILRTALQGTAIQEAVDAGRNGENCTRAYPHCGFSLETILSLMSHIMSTAAAADIIKTTKTTATTATSAH